MITDKKKHKSTVLFYLMFCFIETFVLFLSYAEIYLLCTVVLLVAYSPRFESFYHLFWDAYNYVNVSKLRNEHVALVYFINFLHYPMSKIYEI
jgi:hypothetical protein